MAKLTEADTLPASARVWLMHGEPMGGGQGQSERRAWAALSGLVPRIGEAHQTTVAKARAAGVTEYLLLKWRRQGDIKVSAATKPEGMTDEQAAKIVRAHRRYKKAVTEHILAKVMPREDMTFQAVMTGLVKAYREYLTDHQMRQITDRVLKLNPAKSEE